MLYCNGERHFQDLGCISGYVLPVREKPCTAAGCWQTMPTSKPQLWNCGAVRGDTRSPLGLTWVRSSVQTFIKNPGKGWGNQALQYFFKILRKKTWEGMTERTFLLSSSVRTGIFQKVSWCCTGNRAEIWNCPFESVSLFQCLSCRSRKQNQLKQLLYLCTVCTAYLHKWLSA